MRVKSILNQVEKYKDFVYERVRWQGEGKEQVLMVEMRERAHRPGRCSGCGEAGPGSDELPARAVRVRAAVGNPRVLLYACAGYNSPAAGARWRAVPWAQGCRRQRKKGSILAVGRGPASGLRGGLW